MTLATACTTTLRDGRTVLLRPALPEDAAAIIRYMIGMLPECRNHVLTLAEEFTVTEAEQAQKNRTRTAAGGVLLLAEHDGEVVATLSCESPGRKRWHHVGHVGMASRRAWWGSGIGTAMMRWLIDWAAAHPKIHKLSLSVFADNQRTISLYRRFGFEEEGRQIRETQREPGVFVDDILMARFVK